MNMRAEVACEKVDLITALTARVRRAEDEGSARDAFRECFSHLRRTFSLYPIEARRASLVFESVSLTARGIAANCLPLGISIVMHLYPICALQCVPLPLFSSARFQRAMLVRAIRHRSLIIANAGSERTQGTQPPLIAHQDADGVRIEGTYEYMSLSSVANIVLLQARLAQDGRTILCAAEIGTDSVRLGKMKFTGSMRLSDTSSVTFENHRVPYGRFLIVPNDAGSRCVSDYQRCWFHLFLAEIYLARLDRLHQRWNLMRSAEYIVSRNEVGRLREYALHLLDDFSSNPAIEALIRTTCALKLRASLMAQSTIAGLRERSVRTGADEQELRSDIDELPYIRWQPTADEKILRSLGVQCWRCNR